MRPFDREKIPSWLTICLRQVLCRPDSRNDRTPDFDHKSLFHNFLGTFHADRGAQLQPPTVAQIVMTAAKIAYVEAAMMETRGAVATRALDSPGGGGLYSVVRTGGLVY